MKMDLKTQIKTTMRDVYIAPGEYMLSTVECYISIFNAMLKGAEPTEANASALESLALRGGDIATAMLLGAKQLEQYARQHPNTYAAALDKLTPKTTQLTEKINTRKASLAELLLRIEQACNTGKFPDDADVRTLLAQAKKATS